MLAKCLKWLTCDFIRKLIKNKKAPASSVVKWTVQLYESAQSQIDQNVPAKMIPSGGDRKYQKSTLLYK